MPNQVQKDKVSVCTPKLLWVLLFISKDEENLYRLLEEDDLTFSTVKDFGVELLQHSHARHQNKHQPTQNIKQPWQDHHPNVPPRLLPPQLQRAVVVAKCLRRRGSHPRCRNKKEGRMRRKNVIGKRTRRSVPLMGVQSMLRIELECA